MPQISLYIDKESLKRITAAAKRDKKSVSAWARERLVREPRAAWPDELINTYGSLKDSAIERPPQLPIEVERSPKRR
jgi:hypothetical protein